MRSAKQLLEESGVPSAWIMNCTKTAIYKAQNEAIDEALQQVEKYNTGKELTPIVTAIINSIKQLKK